MPPTDTSAELKALTDEFFRAVSFESGQRPAYARIRDLFIDDGKLIRNGAEIPPRSRASTISSPPGREWSIRAP
jgi:hypothetical protein